MSENRHQDSRGLTTVVVTKGECKKINLERDSVTRFLMIKEGEDSPLNASVL